MLRVALESIAAQTFEHFEVIVVDDGSDADAVRAYDELIHSMDERFVFHRHPTPGLEGTGPSAARNRGIRLARGRFIAFCDDDDRWRLPDHLEVGIGAMRANNADLYFTNMQGESGGEITVPDWFPDSPGLVRGRKVHGDPAVHEVSLNTLMEVMRYHYPHPNGCIISRELLSEIGLFWEPVRAAEDVNLILRAADRARRILYRPDRVVGYNVGLRDSEYARNAKARLMLFCVTRPSMPG